MTTGRPSFVYVTYIRTTPEKLWAALMDPELTKDYWGWHRNVSDWKPGSRWEHRHYEDDARVDIVGEVIESEPPRRLVVSWADPAHESDPAKTSRVTFDIAMQGEAVRLTVLHEDLEPDSAMLRGVSAGWPAVLSSLKTLLETGSAMPGTGREWAERRRA